MAGGLANYCCVAIAAEVISLEPTSHLVVGFFLPASVPGGRQILNTEEN